MISICQDAFKNKIMCNGCHHKEPHTFINGECSNIGDEGCPDCVKYVPLKNTKYHCIYADHNMAGRCIPFPNFELCQGINGELDCEKWVKIGESETCNNNMDLVL